LEIGTWLGNFGTGYSSLSYLRALPLKGVKIDRSFIERTVTDARDFGFLKSLIDLLSYLGMQSIADGVMTKEQYELLSLTTCDLFQGEFFARGMSERQIDQWISEKRGSVRSGGGA
jgi:EAL domain-containing protein (putative c-di-GMP-specific phosphodiesterase class I)